MTMLAVPMNDLLSRVVGSGLVLICIGGMISMVMDDRRRTVNGRWSTVGNRM
jgi:hypothetical protein